MRCRRLAVQLLLMFSFLGRLSGRTRGTTACTAHLLPQSSQVRIVRSSRRRFALLPKHFQPLRVARLRRASQLRGRNVARTLVTAIAVFVSIPGQHSHAHNSRQRHTHVQGISLRHTAHSSPCPKEIFHIPRQTSQRVTAHMLMSPGMHMSRGSFMAVHQSNLRISPSMYHICCLFFQTWERGGQSRRPD
jgi:hypothetical protein